MILFSESKREENSGWGMRGDARRKLGSDLDHLGEKDE